MISVRYILLVAAAFAAAAALGIGAQRTVADDTPQVVEIDRTVQGLNVDDWHTVAARYRQRSRRLRATLLHRASSLEALRLAAVVYHVSFDLLYRKASCESVGRVYGGLNPNAKNRHSTASGLGEFLDSTWLSTPFRSFSVFSPYANALAMGWMHQQGRGGEWAASQGCWG